MAARTHPLTVRSLDIPERAVATAPSLRPTGLARRVLATALAVVALVTGLAAPAAAEPDEGRLDGLFEELAQAQEAYLDAKAALDASVARQQQLLETLATEDAKMAVYREAVGDIARRRFMAAGFTSASGMLSTGSLGQIVDVLALEEAMRRHQTSQVEALRAAVAEAKALRSSIEAEVAQQEAALADMQTRKEQAESALWRVGSGAPAADFGVNAHKIAEPAPRNPDGTWPTEARTVWEPTTSNYITPRMAHARDEAIRAGFTHYVSCYYGGGKGQHPLGRACDFAVEACGICGDVYGADKQYGTDLAAYFVFNAERLGVLYVIWYRQIWLPSSGWRTYSGCCTPSQKHTNHLHLSVY